MLMERAPGRFTLLPLEGVSATDEALFANREWLEKNPRAAEILVESILTTFREIQANPEVVTELRRRYRLLPNITAQQEADILPYFREITEARVLPMNGGGAAAVQDDFAFFTLAGQLQGEASALKVEDFWDFGPLNRVLARIGNR
jgi:NitT/TauT family transport system substrate-binding protein